MPTSRRTAKSSTFKYAHVADDRHPCELAPQSQVIPPKHIPLPDLPISNELYFEIDSLVLSLLVMLGQYVNLYKSVFWLNTSHTTTALNFYLMDPYLIIFNIIIVSRKLPACILKQILSFFFSAPYLSMCNFIAKVISFAILAPLLTFCSYQIFMQHGVLSLICLAYPLIVYVIVIGQTRMQLPEYKALEGSLFIKLKFIFNAKLLMNITHICSISPEIIRDEVEYMTNDFNIRLKLVLYDSLVISYCATFLPIIISETSLYYETYWVGQHIVLTWITCFVFFCMHYFPPRYYDILHRAALHLGKWQKMEAKNIHVPYSTWSETILYNQGTIVKHTKELYRAEGLSNAADPSKSSHYRFYMIFDTPYLSLRSIWALQILTTLVMGVILIRSSTWHDVISIQLIILVNLKLLYIIIKIYYVLKKIYIEEKSLHVKYNF